MLNKIFSSEGEAVWQILPKSLVQRILIVLIFLDYIEQNVRSQSFIFIDFTH